MSIVKLIGELSFVATCIPPIWILMARIIQLLRILYRQQHHAHLTLAFRKTSNGGRPIFVGLSLILEDNTTAVPDAIVCFWRLSNLLWWCKWARIFSPHFLCFNLVQLVFEYPSSGIPYLSHLLQYLGALNRIVHMYCDNIASVFVIYGSCSRTKDGYLSACSRALWFLQAIYNFKLTFTLLVVETIGKQINFHVGIYMQTTRSSSSHLPKKKAPRSSQVRTPCSW